MPRFVRLRASTYAVLSLDSLVFVATPRLAVSQARVVLESRRDSDVGTALQLARNSRNPFPIPPGSSDRIKTAAAVRRDLLRHLSVVRRHRRRLRLAHYVLRTRFNERRRAVAFTAHQTRRRLVGAVISCVPLPKSRE